MATMQQWQSLRHSLSDLPRLFIKAEFDHGGYDIHVTDLSRVWTEKLSKDDILTQANRQNCSVDPSEDDEQLNVLLQKVQSALAQADQTSLSMSTTRKGDLKLRLAAPLPDPLPEFEWEVNLHRASNDTVGEELVLPLLRQARNLSQNMESLIAELQAKDKIISKITDRLETSGHDLSAVFPGVANVKLSRKKSQQEQLARHVKGLGRFDEASWRAQAATGSDDTTIATEVVNKVFSSLPSTKCGFRRSELDDEWWRAIPAGQYLDLGDAEEEQAEHTKVDTNAAQDDVQERDISEREQDDGFQKQATPPHLRHGTSLAHQEDEHMDDDEDQASKSRSWPDTAHEQDRSGDSTDDEDDLDGPSQKSQLPAKPVQPSAEAEFQPPPKSSSTPPVPSPQPNGASTHDDETEDEDDLDQTSQRPAKATPTPQPPSQPQVQIPQLTTATTSSPRKRPGTIGGRSSIPPASKEPTPAQESVEEPEPAPKPKSKLGTLGGKKPQPPPPSSSPPSSPPQSSAPPQPAKRMGVIGGSKSAATPSSNDNTNKATPPAPAQPTQRASPAQRASRREESRAPSLPPEEKANAKRDLLRKELEEKAAKAPAKKKRKF